MTRKFEDYYPDVKQDGIYTAKTIETTGNLIVAGTTTITGAVTSPRGFTTTTSDTTVTAAQSGTVFLATKSSGTQTFTLPAVAAGLTYTFICGHASGEILINPTGSVVITITAFSAVGADADTAITTTAAGTGIKNTAATNAIGDSITLVSDGVGWYGVGMASGIWATQ